MGWFIARRILLACVSLLGVTFIASGLLQLSGDPVALMFQSGVADPAQVEALRHDLMLDRPIVVQFPPASCRRWRRRRPGARSCQRFHRPAAELIFERLPATLPRNDCALRWLTRCWSRSPRRSLSDNARPGHIVALFDRMVVL